MQKMKAFLNKHRPAVIACALIAVTLALSAFFIIRSLRPVSSVETGATAVTTRHRTNPSAENAQSTWRYSTKTDAAPEKITTADEANRLLSDCRDMARSADSVSIDFPEGGSYSPDEQYSQTYFERDMIDYNSLVNGIFNRLQPVWTTEQPTGNDKVEIYFAGDKSFVLVIYKPEGKSKPTGLTIRHNRDTETIQTHYTADNDAYDDICEIIAPYSFDAAKTMAQNFLKAFENKDSGTLKKLSYRYDEKGLKWDVLKPNGAVISNLKYEPVMLRGTQAVYNVSFDLTGDLCAPFAKGRNERVLEIGTDHMGNGIQATKFVEKEKYKEPKTGALEAVYRMQIYSSDLFFDTSALKKEAALGYILHFHKGSKTADGQPEKGFTQNDINRYAKLLFNLDSIDGRDTEYYHADGDYYAMIARGYMQPNCRVYGETEQNGKVFVTAEYFLDGLQTLHDRSIRYELSKNSDGTYCFVSALAFD